MFTFTRYNFVASNNTWLLRDYTGTSAAFNLAKEKRVGNVSGAL